MIKQRKDDYSPDFVVHPGVSLAETLAVLNIKQSELAKRISRPEKTISEIISGNKSITPETAIQLERALDVPASFWNNLEKNYQELRAKISAKKALLGQADIAKQYPYNEMMKLNWVSHVSTLEEKIENLLKFFGVDNLGLVDDVMPAVFRQHNGKNASKHSIQAWLRKGLIDSRNIDTKTFDKEELMNSLEKIKKLSIHEPDIFVPELQKLLADYGVVLIYTHDLPKTYVCGASTWITPQKALIQLSLRGRWSDIMWFTLYHELGHLLLHSKKEYYVDLSISDSSDIEREANEFAAEKLISKERLKSLIDRSVSVSRITKFASELGVHPGIIVGRLQHEGVIKWNQYNSLRKQYVFSNE